MLVSNLNEILFSVNCQIPTLWWRSIPACWGCFMFASAFSWFLEGLRFFISDNNSHQKYSWKKNKSNVSNKIKRWCHTPVFIGSHFPSKLPNYIFFYKKTSKVGCVMKIIFQYFVFFILDLIVFLLVKIVPTHQVFPETKITLVPWWTVFLLLNGTLPSALSIIVFLVFPTFLWHGKDVTVTIKNNILSLP